MSQTTIHGVFPNNTSAERAIHALVDAGFNPGSMRVIGKDGDAFRQATATLQSTKGDKFVLWSGVAGALIGAAAGLVGCPALPMADASTLIMVPFWAVFSGTAIGLSAGFSIGFMLRIDNIPASEANVQLGDVRDGDVAVSVVTNPGVLDLVRKLFSDNGATNISIDLATAYGAETKQNLQLVQQSVPLLDQTA